MKLPVPPLALAVKVTEPPHILSAAPLVMLTVVAGVTVNVLGPDAVVQAPEFTVTV